MKSVSQSFANFNIDNAKCVCVCMHVYVCSYIYIHVYSSLASDSSETVEVIIIKFGTVTASYMGIHHMLIVLTLTLMQGHSGSAKVNQISVECS